VADQANVFQSEAVARLETALNSARQQNVYVYVVTVPSLKVASAKQQEELEKLAQHYVTAWIGNRPGALLIFDDQSGLMSMETSAEARRRYSEVSIHFKLTDALRHVAESGISRDKLERAALTTADVLVDLEKQYQQERRRKMVANTIMAILALVGVFLAIRSAMRDDKVEKAIVAEAAEDEVSKSPPSV
jgi:hypothetical protein